MAREGKRKTAIPAVTTPPLKTPSPSKVAMFTNGAQAVVPAPVAEMITQPIEGTDKVAVPVNWTRGARQKNPPQCNLPPGYRSLRYGLVTFTPELADKFVDAYYANVGSLTRACRATNVAYHAIPKWRAEYPHFDTALKEVDAIIKDEVHSQFMERVLTTWEGNAAWKLTYFKKHFPEYSEKKAPAKVIFNLKDSLIKPEPFVNGDVVGRDRPQLVLDAPAHPGEVSPID